MLKGEFAFEFGDDGSVRAKVGDGVKTWAQLGYFGGDVVCDGKSIAIYDGMLQVAGYELAAAGTYPRKNADGNIEWVDIGLTNIENNITNLQTSMTEVQQVLFPEDEEAQPLLARVEALEEQMGGTGEDSISQRITDEVATQIEAWANKVTDDGSINTVKELIDYVAEHGTETAGMKQDITSLQELVGSTSVAEQINAAISASGHITGVSVGGEAVEPIDGVIDIPVASTTAAGVVKGSDEITVSEDGTLGIGAISVSKIVNDDETVLILNGGGAA